MNLENYFHIKEYNKNKSNNEVIKELTQNKDIKNDESNKTFDQKNIEDLKDFEE